MHYERHVATHGYFKILSVKNHMAEVFCVTVDSALFFLLIVAVIYIYNFNLPNCWLHRAVLEVFIKPVMSKLA